ncbi:MAG: hypothetical protein WDN04_03380 [Rhodospirillales bacterium]
MDLQAAWAKYMQDVEDVRRMFLAEPILQEHPETAAAAYSLLHQTIALSYNLAMSPRQDYPLFYLQSYLDPYVYLGHLPCPDFVYRLVFVNGARTWRIWGKRNSSHWTDIQVHTGFWGEPGFRTDANHDLDDFEIAADGNFEIIASAQPQARNWIRLNGESYNNALLVRQATYDWAREVPIEFNIEPLDNLPARPIVADAEEVTRRLDLAGRMMKHAVSIWTAPASRRLLRHAARNEFVVRQGDGGRGANPLAQYAQGVFELGEDEALIIETAVPTAKYWSIHLGNWWWETLDYSHHKSSINGHQAIIDSDGRFRCVIARHDPGVPNWLDPIVWSTGLMMIRWYRADRELEVTTQKLMRADLRSYLPPDTPYVTAEHRQSELFDRHQATLRRYGY